MTPHQTLLLWATRACAPILLMLSLNFSFAQSTTPKPPGSKPPAEPAGTKKAAKAAVNTVEILPQTKAEKVYVKYSTPVDDGLASYLVQLVLEVTGPRPDKPVTVMLKLDNKHATTLPVFSNQTTSYTFVLPPAVFNNTPHHVIQPVVVQFKTAAPAGEAYIQIDKKTNYWRLNFDDFTKTPAGEEPAGTAKTPPTPAASAASSKPVITLLNGSTEFAVDSLIKPNTFYQKKARLKFKLSKFAGKDTIIKLNVGPDETLQNLKIADADKARAYSVTIHKYDWDDTKEAEVEKTVDLNIEQLAALTESQNIMIRIADGSKGVHTVIINPYKPKEKKTVKLIAAGNAQILPAPGMQIERRYNSAISSLDIVKVKVRFTGKYDADKSLLAFDFADTTLNKTYQIIENPRTVTEAEWIKGKLNTDISDEESKKGIPAAGGIDVELHIRTIKPTDTLNTVRDVDLVIKGQTQIERGSQRLKLIVPDRTFWAEVGTNFDLLDKIKTNNFYAAVFGHMKDIAGKNKRVSLVGGVYESQSVSQSSFSATGFTYRDITSNTLDTAKKGYPIYADTGRVQSVTSVKSIGLMFSPQIRITPGGMNEDGFHLSASGYLEMLWQRITSKIDYSKTAHAVKNYPTSLAELNKYPFKENVFEFDGRSHYLGLGMSAYVKESDYTLYLNVIFGATNQGFSIINSSRTQIDSAKNGFRNLYNIHPAYSTVLNAAEPRSPWNTFYLVQYRLTEVAFGLTFSGEVRGLLLKGAKPVVTLALSKKFDLTALLKPLLAPF